MAKTTFGVDKIVHAPLSEDGINCRGKDRDYRQDLKTHSLIILRMRVIIHLYARVYIEHFVNFVKTNLLLGSWAVSRHSDQL